jgi:hypothetical protein
MIKLTDILNELRHSKEHLINLFSKMDILDNDVYKNLLIHYIEQPQNLEKQEFVDLVSWLIQNKSKYSEVLKPKNGYAYRGTSITPDMFQTIKNKPSKKAGGMSVFKSPYTSESDAQSWTYDYKVAMRFADKGLFNNPRLEKGARPAIIRVKIDDTFVGNPNLTAQIASRLSLKSESEIFHLGTSIADAEWMIPSADIELGKL